MTFSKENAVTVHEFDQVVGALLRESVRGEEPSSKVRSALLRAAAAMRPRPVRAVEAVFEQPRGSRQLAAWREQYAQATLEQRVMVDMLQAHLIGLRFVS